MVSSKLIVEIENCRRVRKREIKINAAVQPVRPAARDSIGSQDDCQFIVQLDKIKKWCLVQIIAFRKKVCLPETGCQDKIAVRGYFRSVS